LGFAYDFAFSNPHSLCEDESPTLDFKVLQLIRLIYGGNFDIMTPRGVTFDDEGCDVHILMRHFKYFGPFLPKYEELFGDVRRKRSSNLSYNTSLTTAQSQGESLSAWLAQMKFQERIGILFAR
jgi:hypothetical protein